MLKKVKTKCKSNYSKKQVQVKHTAFLNDQFHSKLHHYPFHLLLNSFFPSLTSLDEISCSYPVHKQLEKFTLL